MDKFKWIKERVKKERSGNLLQSPDGSMFEILVDDRGIIKTKKHTIKKMSTTPP